MGRLLSHLEEGGIHQRLRNVATFVWMCISTLSITGDNAANNLSIINAIQTKFNVININWPHDHKFYRRACNFLNLVAKEFLCFLGELSDDDYIFFDDSLAISRAPIDDREEDELLPTKELQGKSILSIHLKIPMIKTVTL
ncbi:hypothetical protein O181_039484 [Austropuccinia psidii MF-1]|uniref:Uncharacterized protein n=1 Tax=Austropuccinia psidii MF-1 TaxID=1389203 RepID=A0A9Q3DAJ3_9BASI|nr:hypothetical protein [Austropuccinia psidii MF-1]